MESPKRPPQSDEIEVSVFGPGRGECVVVHLGDNTWIVVDSCVDRKTRRPVALTYLGDLGVDVSKAVRLVVISHWHDDHIRGISEVVRIATSAGVVCSAALNRIEFFQIVAASEGAMMESPGAAECAKVFRIISERAPRHTRPGSESPEWALANRLLFRVGRQDGSAPTEVHALSPAPASLSLAFREIAQSLPSYGAPKRRTVALSPNQVAVVIWIETGNVRILLGSDLEESRSPNLGWQAIINSNERPVGLAQVFKIPHHGSQTAENPEVWERMLESNYIAVVSPYASSTKPLPSPADVQRLCSRARNLYMTASPDGWAPPRRSNTVERTAGEVVRHRRAIVGPIGHVRIRLNRDSPREAKVECDGAARKLDR
jgi:beta-lactamase superfamily II metal-dependent hydrolase